MDQTERELRRNILILEEQERWWKHWHCHNPECDHYTCRVRLHKLYRIRYKLRYFYVKLKFIREMKRYL